MVSLLATDYHRRLQTNNNEARNGNLLAAALSTTCSCNRFIYAFGGAGLFLFITAISGLYGASYNSRHCLNFYSTMVVVMLLAQCALLVGYFADKSWRQNLPHDDTGEAARVCFQMNSLQTFLTMDIHTVTACITSKCGIKLSPLLACC